MEARRHFLRRGVVVGREAIWVPRAIPSKTSWKIITAKRRRKPPATSGATTRVRPITVVVISFSRERQGRSGWGKVYRGNGIQFPPPRP